MSALAAYFAGLPAHTTPDATLTLRRAHAEDAAAVSSFLQTVSTASRRLRFHGSCNPRSQALALQLCQVDGVRHQAWLAWIGSGDDAVVVGEARFVVCADDVAGPGAADLAISVADDWQGRGVADALMRQLLTAAADVGVLSLYGDVLHSNARMKAFMRRHGFEVDLDAGDAVLRMCRTTPAPRVSSGGVRALALNAISAMTLALRRRVVSPDFFGELMRSGARRAATVGVNVRAQLARATRAEVER